MRRPVPRLPLLPIVGLVLMRALRTRGLLLIGVLLPALAVIDEIATDKILTRRRWPPSMAGVAPRLRGTPR